VDPEKLSNPEEPAAAEMRPEPSSDAEEFFQRLMGMQDIRRPQPSAEAIAAALEAIQRLVARLQAQPSVSDYPEEGHHDPATGGCRMCGYENQSGNQFCGMCGAQLSEGPARVKPGAWPSARHHYHHHYHHHFVAGQEAEALAGFGRWSGAGAANGAAKEATKLRTAIGPQGLSRAEATIRQMTQDWAAACNNKQIDDLLEFYATDALVMRPNIPPVRGRSAIREFLVGALEAGLGDVEMEAVRVEVLGDVAYQAGRCKMLVPVVVGKRREERGKYVIVFAKETSGQWKAVVDCWSSDLGLNVVEPQSGGSASAWAPNPRR
jgi:uncharacterized protein (TIGR02246 family)